MLESQRGVRCGQSGGGGRHKFKSLNKTGGLDRAQSLGKEQIRTLRGRLQKTQLEDEESEKASWRREHLSFLLEDESIL